MSIFGTKRFGSLIFNLMPILWISFLISVAGAQGKGSGGPKGDGGSDGGGSTEIEVTYSIQWIANPFPDYFAWTLPLRALFRIDLPLTEVMPT